MLDDGRRVGDGGDRRAAAQRLANPAAAGVRSIETATLLFISPGTVGHHLRKMFIKFNMTPGTRLARSLVISA